MKIYGLMNEVEKSKVFDIVVELREEGLPYREISDKLMTEYGVSIGKSTICDLMNKHEIEKISEDVEDKEVEHDEENLYVYTYRINKYGDEEKIKHKIPFSLVNEIQKSYSRTGKNRTQQQIINHNWGDEDNKIYLKESVWMAIKSALSLNKHTGIANEIFLKILESKYGEEAVEEYVEELAYEVTKNRYKDLEERKLDNAFKKQFESVIRREAKLETYLEKIGEIVKEYTAPTTLKPRKNTLDYSDHLIVAFGDMHVGRTTSELEENIGLMLDYISKSPYENVTLINVGDNLETPMLQGMHVSQILKLDYRGFEQVIKGAQIIESILTDVHGMGKNVEMYGINGNHGRGTVNTTDDPERLPELALYEIVRSRLEGIIPVHYFKDNVNTFTCGNYNIVLAHGENGFATKNTEQIVNIKGSPFFYSIVISGHLHTPKIEQGSGRTRIQTPSLNIGDDYSNNVILKESLPGFVTIETLNNLPLVSFVNCG